MKNRYFYLLGGMLAALGVQAGAQVLNPLPARVLGQYSLPKTLADVGLPPSISPNLVEGREFSAPQAVAIDRAANPPIVYVTDTNNNRVLAWKDVTSFATGAMADLVLGQKDIRSTIGYGTTAFPLTTFSSGLRLPLAVAVDAKGNVFVVDGGNNRIVRFPAPFAQGDGVPVADLVIGQADLLKNSLNRGVANAAPAANSLRTVTGNGGAPYMAGIAFDGNGNLWFTDAGNHRVLRYAASDVSGGGNVTGGNASLTADYVLGQLDFVSAVANPGRAAVRTDQTDKSSLRFCGALAFDDSGNLMVLDDLARVLVFQPPFDVAGKAASRILGVYTPVVNVPPPGPVNDITFGGLVSGYTYVGGPSGVFTVGGYIFVADTAQHRIVRYDPVSTWVAESATAFSPPMSAVVGQADFTQGGANGGGGLEPSATTFNEPVGGAASPSGEVFVVDRGNNRVLVHPFLPENTLGAATRILGQIDFPFRAQNLIEGREFGSSPIRVWFSATSAIDLPTFGLGTALDFTVPQPRMYIADTINNRVLGYNDGRRAQTGDRADIVIGQVDFYRSLVNSPSFDPAKATNTGLAGPGAVAVDVDGNLWVADTGNGRIVRFPRPFDNPAGPFVADLVLGQPDFESRPVVVGAPVPARELLFRPSSLAFTPDGHLIVSDMGQNRVLLYRQPFSNGQPADLVLGQPDYTTIDAGNSDAQLSMPMGVAVDTSNRLYVADFLNRRIMVWDQVSTRLDGSSSALTIPIGGQPQAVAVNPRTGQIWVADTAASVVYRFPEFLQLLLSGNIQPDFSLRSLAPRGLMLEKSDNVWVVDSANRLTLYVPDLTVVNGLNGFARPAPALLAQLAVPGVKLSADSVSASGSQLPLDLGDLQLFVNDVAAPISKVTADALRFIIPKATRPTGLADFVLKRLSTGEIVAYGRKQMYDVSPAVMFQTDNPAVTGPARALNLDGSANSATKPAAAGTEITVFATGFGAMAGLPDDGATGQVSVGGLTCLLRVIGTNTYYGPATGTASLDPDEPGIWRIKVKLPQVGANGTFGFVFVYASTLSDTMTGQTSVSARVSVNK